MKKERNNGMIPFSFRIVMILIIVVFVVLYVGFNYQPSGSHSRGHALVEQRVNLAHTCDGLQLLVMKDPNVLEQIGNNGNIILGPQMMDIIRTSKGGDDLVKWIDQGSHFRDVWKRPLRFRFENVDALSGKAKVIIWSIGPNGIDENGKGDDLVMLGEVHKP